MPVSDSGPSDVPSPDSPDGAISPDEADGGEESERAEGERVKAVYTYDDVSVSVVATLSDASAVPDEAELVVTPVTSQTPGYNYDAYMEALNRGDGGKYTAENTLLYDIAFMVPKRDAEGAELAGELVEVEPEAGTVSVQIQFRQRQLTGELGGTEFSTVEVNHLPLVPSVRSEVDSTREATHISADDVVVEGLDDASATIEGTEQLSFTVDSLSLIAGTVLGSGLSYTVNNTSNAFVSSPYFNSSLELGVAGNFHIVAFDTARLNAHTNGNVLAKNLYANSNFGTNQLTGVPEVSYIQNYLQVNCGSAAHNEDILALGNSPAVGSMDNGNFFTVNGTKLDRPKNIVQDANTSAAPYVDIAALKSAVLSQANSLTQYPTDNVIVNFGDQNNRSMTYAGESGAAYYNMTANELNGISGNRLRIDGFSSGTDQSLVINVDCAGVSNVTMPQEINLYVDGQLVPRNETGNFSTGKVIFNFYNTTSSTDIFAQNVCNQIIAPNANLTVCNGNGNFIANNITITGETHRTDFVGTTKPGHGGFSVKKSFVDGTWPSGKTFSFVLTALDGAPMPPDSSGNSKVVTASDSTAVPFGTITYPYIPSLAGGTRSYGYTITEQLPSGVTPANPVSGGISYDTTVYHVTVTVRYANNKATVESVSYYENDDVHNVTTSNSPNVEFGFTNGRSASGSASLWATKTLSGATLRPGQFSFTLTGEGQNQTASNNASGRADFSAIPYTLADAGRTYHYTIAEVDGHAPGYTYDGHSAEVYVHVADNGDGTLKVTYGATAAAAEAAGASTTFDPAALSASFANSYAASGSASLWATKTLSGATLRPGQFSFTLTGEGQNQTASNNASGRADFSAIPYTLADAGRTYHYTIAETIPEGAVPVPGIGVTHFYKDGYTYDGHSAEVYVHVADNGDGTLKVTYGATAAAAEAAGASTTFDPAALSASFANSYRSTEVILPLTGGSGTRAIYGAGVILLALAAMGLRRQRRRMDSLLG